MANVIRIIKRSIPYMQLLDLNRTITYKYNRRLKLTCLITNRGRSYTRMSRRSRLMFRQLVQQNLMFGFQPSKW